MSDMSITARVCRQFRKRLQRLREVWWRSGRVGGRDHIEMTMSGVMANTGLLKEHTQRSLELPMSGLQELLGLVAGTASRQNKLINHHLFPQRVHLESTPVAYLVQFEVTIEVIGVTGVLVIQLARLSSVIRLKCTNKWPPNVLELCVNKTHKMRVLLERQANKF
jgi:hypothetical protein